MNGAEGSVVLGALDPDAPLPYGRGSILRRVAAEPVTALLVQRALVMDVAHPKVAAGVEDHSGFRSSPNLRAWSTLDAALRLVFGDGPTARHAARQIYRVHDHINGTVRLQNHPSSGHSYTAHDGTLLTWVWATLVDTAEVAFTRWVRPFTAAEGEAFYADMVGFGRFFGIPAEVLPSDRAAFSAYMDGMLQGGLTVGDNSRDLARQILWYRHGRVAPPAVRIQRVLAVRTLDRRLLEQLDVRLDGADERLGRRLDHWLSTYYRHLPPVRRSGPAIYLALRRPTIGLADRARTFARVARKGLLSS